jgi:hypothetical protein
MGVPASINARLFYRCAVRRLEEASMLDDAGCITAGPVYLAGYSIECMLKALILSSLPAAQEEAALASFRGSRAHDYVWLREVYSERSGIRLPPEIRRIFALVSDWSTDLRYEPRSFKPNEIDEFLRGASEIFHWADGRL